MPALPNPATLLLSTADGFEVTSFTKVSLKDSFTDPLSPCQIVVTPPDTQWADYKRRLTKGEEVRVYINQISQGRFIIEEAEREYGIGGFRMTLHLESLLCTPHQGGVNPDFSIAADSATSVDDVIQSVLGPYGFTATVVDGSAHVAAISGKPLPGSTPPAFTIKDLKYKNATAQPNEAALKFLNKIVTRLGVVIRVDGNGTLIVAPPNYTQANSFNVGLEVGTSVLGPDFDRFTDDTCKVTETNKDQYSELNAVGQADQGNPVGHADDATAAEVSRPKAAITAASLLPARVVYASTLHPFKPLYVKDKFSTDAKSLRNQAILVMGSKAAHAYKVTGDVHGWFSRTGVLWSVDMMGRVYIQPEGLDESMWLMERTLIEDEGGQKTSLTLIPKGALVLGDPPGK